MEIHQLKIRSEFFHAVKIGRKKAEFRRNDRNYQVGDLICLWEIGADEKPTFKKLEACITHVTDLAEWAPGYVMLSLDLFKETECKEGDHDFAS